MKKRILSIILAAVTMLSSLQVNVHAEGPENAGAPNEQHIETPAAADADEAPENEAKHEAAPPKAGEEAKPDAEKPDQPVPSPKAPEETRPDADRPDQPVPSPDAAEETRPDADEPDQPVPSPETAEEPLPDADEPDQPVPSPEAAEESAAPDTAESEPVTLTQAVKDITVSVNHAPAGSTLRVSSADPADYRKRIAADMRAEFVEVMALDIRVETGDGAPLSAPVTVSVKYDGFRELPDGAILYHVHDRAAKRIPYRLEAGKTAITFAVGDFSPFVLVCQADAAEGSPETEDDTEIPETDPRPEDEEAAQPEADVPGQTEPIPEDEEAAQPEAVEPGQTEPLPEDEEAEQPETDESGQIEPLPEDEEQQPETDVPEISDPEPEALTQVCEDRITVSVADAPEGAVLSVTPLDAADYMDAIGAASDTDLIEPVMALDISVKTADETPLAAPVTVSVKCDDFSKLPGKAVLYHVKGHAAEPVAYTLDKETATIVFRSQDFSPFVLVRPARGKGMPLMAPQNDPNSVYFVRVSPYNEYDVRINGTGSVVTIYCLQQKDTWPGGDVGYVPHASADDSYNTEDVNLLTASQIQILKRLVFAGYPHDSQGILRKHGLGGAGSEQLAGLMTNVAIWTLMTEWNKAGSDPAQTYAVADEVVRELVDYATSSHVIAVPSSIVILIEGSGKLSYANNKWSTGELMITQPAGYDLHFALNLPSGATAIDAAGQPITTVDDGDPFWIVADDPDALTSFEVEASAVASYPTDINFFVTKDVSGSLDPATMLPKAYQTMLYIEKATMNLSGSLSLTKDRVGSISVEKEVTGDGADLNKSFDFAVMLSDTSINGLYGEMTFVNGVANFSLKHGETKVAQDLPADIQYVVSESAYPRYEVTKRNETGTVQDGTTISVSFVNRYQPAGTSVTLSGHKTFTGFPADSGIKPVFTFTLSENGTVIDTKTVTMQGDYAFDSIPYTEAGVHTYTVAETAGSQSGVTYDSRTYTVTVTVTDNQQGELVAVISGGTTTGKNLDFTNSYKAAPAEVQFSGLKTLEGRALADKEFSFTLTGADDGVSETVQNDADGRISFTKITYSAAGTYAYTVKEEATTEAGVTIDGRTYSITVTVTDDGSGQLKTAITGSTETGKDLNFTNKYQPAGTNVTLSGHKTFTGFPADSAIKPVFTFTLSENGAVIDTKTVTMQGDYAFDSIPYTEAGVHTYIIDEVEGTQSGVTYDSRTYTVTVTVTDNQQGELAAVISGGSTTGKDLDFTNDYKAAPTAVQFSGWKTLRGRALADKEFSFTLTGADDGTSETVQNDADGKIFFTKITYSAAGTYAYTVKEEATNKAGVTIDRKIYRITVTVTDDGSGQLKAAIDGSTGSDLNFVNRYDPDTPKTSDDSNIILWLALLGGSGFILIAAVLYGRKKKNKENKD